MAISEAKKRANEKWNSEHMKERYDRIQIVVQKGKRERIQEAAKQNGETVSGMINRLIDSELERLQAAGGSGISGGSSEE